VERAAALVPLDRVIVIVTAHHEARAREQLARYPGVELVIQPRNLDTAPGLMLPLARIRARDRNARVAFLPSDHHVVNAGPILAAIADSAHGSTRAQITLLGVDPDHPEIEYGWITRGRAIRRRDGAAAFAVDGFVEKPAADTARELHARGALWNTFISVGPVEGFWRLARSFLPDHSRRLEDYATRVGAEDEHAALTATYAALPPANFSSEVFSRARKLVVIPVTGSGWCDWGSPDRVFRSLAGTPHHEALVARIAGSAPVALAS